MRLRPKFNGARMLSTVPGNRTGAECGLSHFNAQPFARRPMRLWCACSGDIFMRVAGLGGISITSDNNFAIHLSNSSSAAAAAAA